MIRGGCGGGALVDCYSEWLAQPAPARDRFGVPVPSLTCRDDDPSCDFGPPGDQACTFRLSVCLNVNDRRIACTAPDVANVDLWLHARLPEYRDALVTGFTALGGVLKGRCHSGRPGQPCSLNADCDSSSGSADGLCKGYIVQFTPPLTVSDACTEMIPIRVPLRQTRVGFIRGFLAFGVTTHPSNDPITGRRRMADRDVLRFYCNP
jgi:hypothetical protein